MDSPGVRKETANIERDEVCQRELDATFKASDRDGILVGWHEPVHLHVSVELFNRLDEDLVVELALLSARVNHLTLKLSRGGQDERVAKAGDNRCEVRAIRVLQERRELYQLDVPGDAKQVLRRTGLVELSL